MKYQMSKSRETLFLITLFLSNVIVIADSIISPTVSTLYGMFPDSTTLLNFSVSGCYILMAVLTVFIGKLCSRVDMKLLTVGALFGVAGGVGLSISYQPLFMVVMRGPFMVSYAFTSTVGMTVLTAFYMDDDRRNRAFGTYNASFCAVGALLSLAAGKLASVSVLSASSRRRTCRSTPAAP